jgi:FkbM family methyltransferase
MPVNLSGTSIKTLTNIYWLARKSRVLDTGLGRRAFAASYFLYKRYLEDPFHDLVQRHGGLFRGGNILDIGANIGYTATVFSRAVDPEYKVYAFEPEHFNYDLLERSVRARKTLRRIVPIRSAVGDRDGTIELWENEHHHADHRILTDQFRGVRHLRKRSQHQSCRSTRLWRRKALNSGLLHQSRRTGL